MSDPIRIAADPARAVKDYLATVLPPLVDGVDPTVTLGVPGDWTPASAPHVGVFDDGGPALWPVYDAPRVRVTVWADGRTRAREIAGLCRGIVTARSIPGVARVSDPSALLDARDDHNGGAMASFHVLAIARTIAV